MGRFLTVALLVALVALSGCSSKFKSYDGPEVTRVLVYKKQRVLFLMHGNQALKAYKFRMGFSPLGHKQFEGDGRTPEGNYIIDTRNPDSNYHLSVRINYPNAKDVEVARSYGRSPGGDIFIHGTPRAFLNEGDWTWGCIAVSNEAIEEIYAMVHDGTPISIYP
jgi:murein L,D-transpeptidase YafK